MRFLADESLDFSAVRALRAAGHDVVAVAELYPSENDEVVIKRALNERRVLITEDKDFGQLVHAYERQSSGVILLRFPGGARLNMPNALLDVVTEWGDRLHENFIVIQPGRIRISQLTDESE